MLISGIEPFTLLDYPGKTACIIFTAGCTFRCGYCHNAEFVLPELLAKMKGIFIPESAIFNFLEKRRGLLEGVVISGGEPTVQPDLLAFIEKVKRLGFLVKLDTNGNRPEVVRTALASDLLDYIAMDVKTSLKEYQKLVGPFVKPESIQQSIDTIKSSDVPYEFRSTLIKEVHSDSVIDSMVQLLQGTKQFYLQSFRPETTLNPLFVNYHPFSKMAMASIAERFAERVVRVTVRE